MIGHDSIIGIIPAPGPLLVRQATSKKSTY
jgi:hypothetical protein